MILIGQVFAPLFRLRGTNIGTKHTWGDYK